MALSHGSLFTGIGGFDLGLEWAGFESAWQVENNKFCNQVLEKRWPNVQRFLDVKTVGKHNLASVDIISGGFPCFASGTLILTYAGFKSIETVQVGDLVLTHLGRWKTVTSVMSREADSCRLVEGQGILPTITTDEHPYFVRRKIEDWKKWSAPEWEFADTLSKGAMLGQVLPPVKKDSRSLAFWWLVGRYLADGWRVVCNGKGRVVICCNRDEEKEVANRIREAGYNYSKDRGRTVTKFHITVKSFYAFLLPFGAYAHGKLLPGWVLSLSSEKAESLLDGYFTGDGCQYKNKNGKIGGRKSTTVSPALSLSIALLIQRARGLVASVFKYEVPKKTVIEGREVNQRTQYQVMCATKNSRAFVEVDPLVKAEYGWKPLRKTEVINGTTVHNISVADDESYIANGAIVHNCQDISIGAQFKERGLGGERSGLWSEYARIVRELRPRWVLIENVPNLKTHGADTVIDNMEEAGYSCWPTVVGVDTFGAPFQRRRVFILCRDNANGYCDIGSDVAAGWTLSPELEGSLAQASQNWNYWKHELGAGNARAISGTEESELDSYARGLRTVYGVPDWMDRLKALGNACTPVIPALIGAFIVNYDQKMLEATAELY